jgi:hypothetical protein
MRIHIKLTLALAIVGVMAWAAPASATIDKTGTVAPGAPFQWTGTTATGLNVTNYINDFTECGKDINNYCDIVLLRFDFPIPDDQLPAPSSEPQTVEWDGTGKVTLDNYSEPFAAADDFDLWLWYSDAQGAEGDFIDIDGKTNGEPENLSFGLASFATVNPDGSVERQETTYILAKIAYWSVINSSYRGTAKIL